MEFGFDAFISYSSQDQEWVLGWLAPRLNRAGLRICVDRFHFDAGVPALENMVNAVGASRHTVLVLTPAWVKSQWTRFESLLAQMGDPIGRNQRVIPVLRRPCEPLPPNIAILSYLDLSGNLHMEAEVARLVEILSGKRRLPPSRRLDNRGRIKLNDKYRRIMLESVKEHWISSFLEKSVFGLEILPVGLRKEPGEVWRPWDMILEAFDRESQVLPAGSRILDVYDNIRGSLLILGEPGAGKTTALLELARDAITRAEEDSEQPLPIVFNLSSWAARRWPLTEWLVDELNTKYSVPPRVGRKWVKKDQLLLLLDGLDEVQADHRIACAQTINDFILSHGFTQIVVCSRTDDYRAMKQQLGLKSAVMLQPLTVDQLDEYLERAGGRLAAVREAITEDAELREMARSPLMLSILVVTYGDFGGKGLPIQGEKGTNSTRPRTPEEQRRIIFDTYILKMLQRRGAAQEQRYPPEQILARLGWLARRIGQQGESVFLLEQMQPDWLRGGGVHLFAAANALIIALLLGGPVIVIRLWEAVHRGLSIDLKTFAGMLLFFGVPFVAGYDMSVERIRTVGQLQWSWKRASKWLIGVFFFSSLSFADVLKGLLPELLKWGGFGALGGAALGALLRRAMVARVSQSENEGHRLRRGLWALFDGKHGAILFGGMGIAWALVKWIKLLQSSAGVELLGSSVERLLGTFALLGPVVTFFGGLSRHDLERESRVSANAAIHRTVKSALLVGTAALLVTLLTAALFRFRAPRTFSEVSSNEIVYWAFLAYYICVFACLWAGGFSCIRHYVLRWVLARQDRAPWDYSRFLDYCSQLIFLRRVGVGYVFVHRLLAEHIASSGDDSDPPPYPHGALLMSPDTANTLRLVAIGAGMGIFFGVGLSFVFTSIWDNLMRGHHTWPIAGAIAGVILAFVITVASHTHFTLRGLFAGTGLACLVAAVGGSPDDNIIRICATTGVLIGTVCALVLVKWSKRQDGRTDKSQ